MWIILDINYNDFYHTGKSQICAGAWYVFRTSKLHSGMLWGAFSVIVESSQTFVWSSSYLSVFSGSGTWPHLPDGAQHKSMKGFIRRAAESITIWILFVLVKIRCGVLQPGVTQQRPMVRSQDNTCTIVNGSSAVLPLLLATLRHCFSANFAA